MTNSVTTTFTQAEMVALISVLTPIAMGYKMGFGIENEQARATVESALNKILVGE
jgi:hypothetical protein